MGAVVGIGGSHRRRRPTAARTASAASSERWWGRWRRRPRRPQLSRAPGRRTRAGWAAADTAAVIPSSFASSASRAGHVARLRERVDERRARPAGVALARRGQAEAVDERRPQRLGLGEIERREHVRRLGLGSLRDDRETSRRAEVSIPDSRSASTCARSAAGSSGAAASAASAAARAPASLVGQIGLGGAHVVLRVGREQARLEPGHVGSSPQRRAPRRAARADRARPARWPCRTPAAPPRGCRRPSPSRRR